MPHNPSIQSVPASRKPLLSGAKTIQAAPTLWPGGPTDDPQTIAEVGSGMMGAGTLKGAGGALSGLMDAVGVGVGQARKGAPGALQGLRGLVSRGAQTAKGFFGGGRAPSKAIQGLSGATAEVAPGVRAEFGYHWPELGGPQYKILGGESSGSHVMADTLKQMGIPIPHTPPPKVPYPSAPATPTVAPEAWNTVNAHQDQAYQGILKQAMADRKPNMQTQAVRDVMNPRSLSTMDKMFAENNPIFKKLEAQGMFKGRR